MAGADPDPDGSSGREGWIEPPTTTNNVGVVVVVMVVIIIVIVVVVSEAAKTSLQNKDGVGESKRKGRKEGGEERDERVRIRVYINWMREGESVCEWTSRKSTS